MITNENSKGWLLNSSESCNFMVVAILLTFIHEGKLL